MDIHITYTCSSALENVEYPQWRPTINTTCRCKVNVTHLKKVFLHKINLDTHIQYIGFITHNTKMITQFMNITHSKHSLMIYISET